MAFESANSSFSEVVSVIMSVCKLVMELLGFNGCNEILGDFIVKALERRNDSCLFELVVTKIVALD